MIYLIAIVAVIVLFPLRKYWLGPILVHSKSKMGPISYRIATEEDRSEVPDLARAFVEAVGQDVHALGFTSSAPFVTHGHGARSFGVLLENPRTGELAVVAATWMPESPASIASPRQLLHFRTDWEDGVTTTTAGVLKLHSPFPKLAFNDSIDSSASLTQIALYRAHQVHVARRNGVAKRVPLTRGPDPMRFEGVDGLRTYEGWLAQGFLRREGAGFVTSWKGAIVMTYRMLSPWKGIIARRKRAEGDALLAELG